MSMLMKHTADVAKPLALVKYVTYAGEYAAKCLACATQHRAYWAYVGERHKYASNACKRTVYVAKPLAFVKYVTYACEYAPKHPANAPQHLTYVAYVRGRHQYA